MAGSCVTLKQYQTDIKGLLGDSLLYNQTTISQAELEEVPLSGTWALYSSERSNLEYVGLKTSVNLSGGNKNLLILNDCCACLIESTSGWKPTAVGSWTMQCGSTPKSGVKTLQDKINTYTWYSIEKWLTGAQGAQGILQQ